MQLQWPRGFTCARKLRYTGSTIVQLDTHFLQYRSKLESSLTAEVDCQKLYLHFFFFLSIFISLIYLLYVYTPSVPWAKRTKEILGVLKKEKYHRTQKKMLSIFMYKVPVKIRILIFLILNDQ